MKLPWSRDADGRKLSAYLDRELDQEEEAELSDRLVFDEQLRGRMAAVRRVDLLASQALAVDPAPDAAAIAEKLVGDLAPGPAVGSAPAAGQRSLRPALYASVGILITVGITFVGLRRRGLV